MCCTLVGRDFNENGHGFAGRLGNDQEMADFATEQALSGCLVSSLHRLKDFNNTGNCDIMIRRSGVTDITNQMQDSLCFLMCALGLRANFASASASLRSLGEHFRCSETVSPQNVNADGSCGRPPFEKVIFLKAATSEVFTCKASFDLTRAIDY